MTANRDRTDRLLAVSANCSDRYTEPL